MRFYRQEADRLSEMAIYGNDAIVLNNIGDHAYALRTIDEAIRLCDFMKLDLHRPNLMETRADILLDLGCRNEAESVWGQILDLLDRQQDLGESTKLRVMTNRIRYLVRLGRMKEAVKYKKKVVRFATASSLNDYGKAFLAEFDETTVKPAPDVERTRQLKVDLQPVYASTRAVPGNLARTVLWLSNPSPVQRRGLLTVNSDRVATLRQDEALCVHVSLSTQAIDNAAVSRRVEVAPGTMSAIDLVYPNPACDAPSTVTVTWQGNHTQSARWDVISDTRGAVHRSNIHAGILLKSAFFKMPVYLDVLPCKSGSGTARNYKLTSPFGFHPVEQLLMRDAVVGKGVAAGTTQVRRRNFC